MLARFCTKLRPLHGLGGSSYIELRIVPIPPVIKRFFPSEEFATDAERIAPKIASLFSDEAPDRAELVQTLPWNHGCTDKAELAKTLLRNYGCTESHISKLTLRHPKILSSDPQKTLLPKLEFFRSIGLSSIDIPRIICGSHSPYNVSLEKLISRYNFIKSLLPLDEDVLIFLKYYPETFRFNVEKTIVPNLAALREAGAPQSIISSMLRLYPKVVCIDCQKFKDIVKKALGMGFNPLTGSFGNAVQVLVVLSESTWEHKMVVYRRCGLSNDEILRAFRWNPRFMSNSEAKIMETADFLVKKMGWQPAAIAKFPTALNMNLEKRIIPRCAVVKILQAHGLMNKDLSLDNFVNKHQDVLPGLMNIFLGKN